MDKDPPPSRAVLRSGILPQPRETGTHSLAVLVVVVGALYFGRDVFVPLALAGLLSFALAPLIAALRRRGIPRTPAVIGVVVLAFLGIFVFGFVVAGQVSQLGSSLPSYEANIREKIRSLQSNAPGGGLFERAAEVLRDLRQDIDEAAEPPAARTRRRARAGGREPEPIPVQITQPDPAPLELLQTIIGPLIEPLATTGIVIVFVVFMLLQREDLRDRFIRLVGASDLHRTTQALSDAGERVGRYLLMQLLVNVAYGIPIGIGLWLIGVPNPLLWGMLSIVLRFVPYIGPVIAAAFPLALSIAVDPGWSMLFWTAALFIVLELISGNIVEPWLYGASTGLSSIAILAAAIFWTWLWGPIGLLLSTPLTVCLVVLGRHVPQFAFLNVLLGSEPVWRRRRACTSVCSPTIRTRRPSGPRTISGRNRSSPTTRGRHTGALHVRARPRPRGPLDERRALVTAGALRLVDNLSEHEDATARRTPTRSRLPPISLRIGPAPAGRIGRYSARAGAATSTTWRRRSSPSCSSDAASARASPRFRTSPPEPMPRWI